MNNLDHFTKVKQMLQDKKFPTPNDMLLAFTELSAFTEDLLKLVEQLTQKIEAIESDREARMIAIMQRVDLHYAILNTLQRTLVEKQLCTNKDLDKHFAATIEEMKAAAEKALKEKETTDSIISG